MPKNNITDPYMVIGSRRANDQAGVSYVVFGQRSCESILSASPEKDKARNDVSSQPRHRFKEWQFLSVDTSSATHLEPFWVNPSTRTFQAISSMPSLVSMNAGNTELALTDLSPPIPVLRAESHTAFFLNSAHLSG